MVVTGNDLFRKKIAKRSKRFLEKKYVKKVAVYNTFFSMYDKLKKVPPKRIAYAGYRTQYLQLFVRLLSMATPLQSRCSTI